VALSAWILAARPRTLTAAAAPVLVGTGLAAHDGVLAVLPATAALLGALLMRGGDSADRVGPVRVTQAGLIAPGTVRRAMVLVLASALLPGAYLVWVGGWPILAIGLASLACAVLYTGGPFPLAYHGLGDLFVFVFFGLVAVGGTYWVQALAWSPDALLAGTGVGALSTAVLVANNLRDIETDERAGKRTLAVRLGRTGTRIQYALLLGVAAAVPLVGVVAFDWPAAVLAVLLVAPLSSQPLGAVMNSNDPQELIAALGGTARVVALYAGALAIGLAVG
jgi:1,4-dihydroxy-2-naphthoate octaprenyltransferase